MTELATQIFEPTPGMEPKQLVFMFHGLGANSNDMMGLAPELAKKLPNAIFIAPDAPFPCDMAEGMKNSFQWFSMKSRDKADWAKGAEEAHKILNAFIDEKLEEYDLTDRYCAMVGFSQGTMMALYTGPRRLKTMSGILGYSGSLIGEEEFSGNNYRRPAVHLYHGEMDMVVAVEEYKSASERLEKLGFHVTGETSPFLDHSIDAKGIESGAKFLADVFSF